VTRSLAPLRRYAPPLAGLLLAAGAGACTSTVWFGRSPDRAHLAEVLALGAQQWVRLDGQPQVRFQAIGVESLRFSPDGRRLAYPARRHGRWVLIVDGLAGRAWDGIGEVRFSPDSRRVAYGALLGARWRIVCDDRSGPEVDAVLAGSLSFSSDGRRLAYAAAVGDERRVVLDDRPGPAYRGIARLAFDGTRLRYVARAIDGARLVVDGREGPAFADITEVAPAVASGRLAYLARTGAGMVAVVDDEPGPLQDELAALRWSADGKHLAFAARRGERAQVILDGVEGPLFEGIRFQTLAFTGSGKLLYVARERGRYRVVHDRAAGPALDDVDLPAAGPGERWGYIGRTGRRFRVVIDGRIAGEHDWAGDLSFGADGTALYAIGRGRDRAVVHGDRVHPLQVLVEGTLLWSRDGRHWACLSGDRRRRELFLSVDGLGRRPFDLRELIGAAAHGAGGALRDWVRAELEASTVGWGSGRTGPRSP
jgi:hypothetical protein